MVERGPEKAGVGGSIPSLGISLNNLLKKCAGLADFQIWKGSEQ